MSTETPSRKPYTGSCHCGHIRYVVHLTLPPAILTSKAPADQTVRIRKCNCTTCHKFGYFHVRLPCAPDDFYLLSPVPATSTGDSAELADMGPEGLSVYRCFSGASAWYFCGKCGTRCFTCFGPSEVVEMDVPEGLKGVEAGTGVKVWKLRKDSKEGWREGSGGNGYFTLNAHTLEAGQDGLDLREWHEKGWILYLDCLDGVEENRFGRPLRGGLY
ncbi:hypothetical protein P152DRAFT_402230 [Eremomyces bilateralis CBS 781.70]|uniref:CENP-V/GFA domain-containing protein n=1 Tax=Eremomyces bilateralis CBS 781.70 TaxID=1392243 RepID=A0A6G1FWF7_9PEZI|nr:uncharacterized protein P152DRAFT_402230 [Eremomyces bilateralis CBS 781.70]KAF1809959.1 hypothetical protein P152DRAFT_402230 [Eremomyces bilateralis CBS 781.70]